MTTTEEKEIEKVLSESTESEQKPVESEQKAPEAEQKAEEVNTEPESVNKTTAEVNSEEVKPNRAPLDVLLHEDNFWPLLSDSTSDMEVGALLDAAAQLLEIKWTPVLDEAVEFLNSDGNFLKVAKLDPKATGLPVAKCARRLALCWLWDEIKTQCAPDKEGQLSNQLKFANLVWKKKDKPTLEQVKKELGFELKKPVPTPTPAAGTPAPVAAPTTGQSQSVVGDYRNNVIISAHFHMMEDRLRKREQIRWDWLEKAEVAPDLQNPESIKKYTKTYNEHRDAYMVASYGVNADQKVLFNALRRIQAENPNMNVGVIVDECYTKVSRYDDSGPVPEKKELPGQQRIDFTNGANKTGKKGKTKDDGSTAEAASDCKTVKGEEAEKKIKEIDTGKVPAKTEEKKEEPAKAEKKPDLKAVPGGKKDAGDKKRPGRSKSKQK